MVDLYDPVQLYDTYDPSFNEPQYYNEENFANAVEQEKLWKEKLENTKGKYNPLRPIRRFVHTHWTDYIDQYNKYWKERNEKASTKSPPAEGLPPD